MSQDPHSPAESVRPEPLHLDSRESAATVQRMFEEYRLRQEHALAVLDDPSLTRFERAALATKMLQVLAGYRGRKPREGDAGRPAIAALSVAVMERRAQDLRDVVNVDGPAAGLTDMQVKHEVAKRLDLSWERLRQILTGQLGTGALRRRAKSDRPAGRPPRVAALPPASSEPLRTATEGHPEGPTADTDGPADRWEAPEAVEPQRSEPAEPVADLMAGMRSR